MPQKPSYFKLLLYLLTKYAVFFTVLAFMDDRFKTLVLAKAHNNHEVLMGTLFYSIRALWSIFILVMMMIVPLYLLFKVNNLKYLVPAFSLLIIYEYYIYEPDPSHINFDINGIVNGAITIVFFPLFFGTFIKSLMRHRAAQMP